MPPHAYPGHVRVERARTLLGKGMSPADGATCIGFADQSHFARDFMRILHVTRSRYAPGRRAAYFASSRASLSSEVAPVSRLAAVAGSKLDGLRVIGNGFRILKDCG